MVQSCRRVVPKYSVLDEGRTCLTKNSVLTDYLKVDLRVNSNGPLMKPQLEFFNKLIREFLPSIFRSEALFGHPVLFNQFFPYFAPILIRYPPKKRTESIFASNFAVVHPLNRRPMVGPLLAP